MRKILFVVTAVHIVTATALVAQLPLIPASVKYRDTSKPPGKGRSGSATVQGLALLAKNGDASINVTTGELGTASEGMGSIEEIQVKIYSPISGKLLTTDVHKKDLQPGGRQELGYNGLARGQQVDLQASISGVDRGTDVVTINEQVKLRPDLVMESFAYPRQVYNGLPITFTAVVSEKNHDIGAWVTVGLMIDNSLVGSVKGWVDAGGTVSFRYDLTPLPLAIGPHTIGARILTTSPSDFDYSNNDAPEGTFEVLERTVAFDRANIQVVSSESLYHDSYSYNEQGPGSSYERHSNYDSVNRSQTREFEAVFQSGFPSFPVSLKVREWTNDHLLNEISLADLLPSTSSGSFDCAYRYVNQTIVKVCSAGGTSYLHVDHDAGDVTYFSTFSELRIRDGQIEYYYVDNRNNVVDHHGEWADLGSSYSVEAFADNRMINHFSTVTVPLDRNVRSTTHPLTCSDASYGSVSTHSCSESSSSDTSIRGAGGY